MKRNARTYPIAARVVWHDPSGSKPAFDFSSSSLGGGQAASSLGWNIKNQQKKSFWGQNTNTFDWRLWFPMSPLELERTTRVRSGGGVRSQKQVINTSWGQQWLAWCSVVASSPFSFSPRCCVSDRAGVPAQPACVNNSRGDESGAFRYSPVLGPIVYPADLPSVWPTFTCFLCCVLLPPLPLQRFLKSLQIWMLKNSM